MPVVPFTQRQGPAIPDWAMPSDTHFAMAAASLMMQAAIAHEQGVLKDFRNPDEPSANKGMRDYIEKAREREEDPDIPKVQKQIIPGERAVDRERGLMSDRDIYRF